MISVSSSVLASGTVGFLGGTATGGVETSAGASERNSFSRALQASVFRTGSTGDTVEHVYRMDESTGCSPSKPTDLVGGIARSVSFSASFSGAPVFPPPDLALHDFPVISQGVSQATNADTIDEDASLCIHVTQHVYVVEGTNAGLQTQAHFICGQGGTWDALEHRAARRHQGGCRRGDLGRDPGTSTSRPSTPPR